jgi:hypothetical protein
MERLKSNCFVRASEYNKVSLNTKRATTSAIQSIRDFYVDARKKNGELYKLTALKSIRFNLARHFSQELEMALSKILYLILRPSLLRIYHHS